MNKIMRMSVKSIESEKKAIDALKTLLEPRIEEARTEQLIHKTFAELAEEKLKQLDMHHDPITT